MSRTRRVRANIALALFLVLLVLPAASGAQAAPDDSEPADTFDPHANPVADLNRAIAEAQQTHRRILLDVGGQWCVWCKYLDQFFDSHPDLKDLRDKNYVWVKINFSRDNENRQFLSQYPAISGYPHIFVLTSDGRFYHSQETRPLENGAKSYDPERTKDFLVKWAPPQESDSPML
jgi:thiol:disulfide interchange protein